MNNNEFIKAERERLENIDDNYDDVLSNFGRNLNLEAIKGNLTPVYDRDEIVNTMQKILLRRTKANILLVGSAGCGKTALAEAFASLLVEQQVSYMKELKEAEKEKEEKGLTRRRSIEKPLFYDCVVYDLSMNSLLSGTTYRGDFERRMEGIINITSSDKRIILFIDEIHQINSINKNSANGSGENSMGQILKPALARGDVRVIGATTTEESKAIKNDKALARRFSEVFVPQLTGDSAIHCLEKIMEDYSKYYKIKFDDSVVAEEIYNSVCYNFPQSIFPNNVIDIIDEALASAKFENKKSIGKNDIANIFNRMIFTTPPKTCGFKFDDN